MSLRCTSGTRLLKRRIHVAGGSAKQRVKTGLVAESLELVCMVVIDEPQPRGLHSLSEVDGLCPETTVALLRPVGLRKTRDDDVLATPLSALGNHAFEVRVQTLQRDMACASDQIRAPKLFTESPDRRRPKPCHLDGPVADLAQAAQDAAQDADGHPDRVWYEAVVNSEIAPLLREYWFDDAERVASIVDGLLK